MMVASSASGKKLSYSHQAEILKRPKELLLHCLREKKEHDLDTEIPGSAIQR